jgi:hypothetical protein
MDGVDVSETLTVWSPGIYINRFLTVPTRHQAPYLLAIWIRDV